MNKEMRKDKFLSENAGFEDKKNKVAHKTNLTIDDIKTIIRLYPTETNKSIAKMLNLTTAQFSYVVSCMREGGVNLPKKYKSGIRSQVNALLELLNV